MVKKFQSVLAFGDSHVAGCELSNKYRLDQYCSGEISIEEADSAGKELAFPKIVADRLGVPCYNYAMTGGSNSRSLRKLISAIQEHPNSLVLFGYTCTDRNEFYFPDRGHYLGKDSDNFLQVGMQWRGKIASAKLKNPLNDLYVDEIIRPYNNLKDLAFIVENVCMLNALSYRHIPLFPETFPDVDNLLDFEGCENYLNWCNYKKFNRLPYLHYGIDAHQSLAELILKDLNA